MKVARLSTRNSNDALGYNCFLMEYNYGFMLYGMAILIDKRY